MAITGMKAALILTGTLAWLPVHGGLLAEVNLPPDSLSPLALVAMTDADPTRASAEYLVQLALGTGPATVDFARLQANPLTGQPLYPTAQGIDFIPVTSSLQFGTLPEPGTLSLFGLALLGWAFARHRRP